MKCSRLMSVFVALFLSGLIGSTSYRASAGGMLFGRVTTSSQLATA